ncbi:MAG TPA: hypothetical protein VFQ61_24540 [Polyangiaceae bacterium]|nr:hypothetical protein [Polyangiaceae bacterium]
MTKRTRLLAISLLSFPTGLSLAACTGGNGSAGSGGSSSPSGGAAAKGGTTASSGGTTTGSGGTTASSGGNTSNSGGSSNSSGGATNSSGGATSSSGGSTSSSGGNTASSGGKTGSGGTAGGGGTSTASGGMTGSAGSAGGSSTGQCTLPKFPDASSLPVNKKLPDPFTFFDGTKVTTKAQWECRRQEILAMAAKYIYDPVPTKPDEVTGTVSGGTVSITVKVGSKSDTFSATISGSGTAIALELSGGIFPSSHKKLSFATGFENKIKSLYGFSANVNTNIANGWMIDRVMDVLEKNPSSGHDPTKIMVSGCSGCGKGAYLAGVFSRAPLVVIVESGGGGAANLRQAEWFRHGDGKSVWKCADDVPQSIDNLESNGICGPWITNTAQWLVSSPSKVNNLPFDTHLLLATIAPRYLLHFSNNNGVNSWCHLGGTCEALSAWAAKPVWKALGVPERMGFHMYSAGHCSNPAEATALAGEFFKRAIDGNMSAKTDVMDIMDNGVQQPVSEWKTMWVDWNMDTVLQ